MTRTPEAITAEQRCAQLTAALHKALRDKGAKLGDGDSTADRLRRINGEWLDVRFAVECAGSSFYRTFTGRVRLKYHDQRWMNVVVGEKFDVEAFAGKLIGIAARKKAEGDLTEKLRIEAAERDQIAEQIHAAHGVNVEHSHGKYYLSEGLTEAEAEHVAAALVAFRKAGAK